jgi:hypothetical protein
MQPVCLSHSGKSGARLRESLRRISFPLLLATSLLLCSCAGVASIAPDPARLTIQTATLDPGQVGVPYHQQLTASGGSGPYSWSITEGTLPPGLSLSSTGMLSGTPSASGTFNFVITATDAKNASASVRVGSQI